MNSRSESLMHFEKARSMYMARRSGHFNPAFIAAADAGLYRNNYLYY
jgi:hypothetical protein